MVTMVTNVYSFLASGGGEGSPPMGRVPYPVKHQSFGVKNGQSNSFEKRALIRENNKFEKLVEKKQQLKVIPEIKIKLASFNSITLSLSLSLFLSHTLSLSVNLLNYVENKGLRDKFVYKTKLIKCNQIYELKKS